MSPTPTARPAVETLPGRVAEPPLTRLGAAMLAVALIWLLPDALAAHEGGAAVGLFNGLKHPVSGVDHVLAMVAVGLWGAQLGQPAVWVLPVVFPMVMALGGMLGLLGIPIPGVEIGIALSAVVLGVVVLGEVKPPVTVTALIVGLFAVFHGHAHGAELPEGASGVTYSLGFVVATGTLHAVGIAIGLVHRWPAGQKAVRVAGAGVAAAGVAFLARALGWGDG
ncbi:MAG TPA: HupE/UreJ family protein [Longimicrobiales bacterium]|nr:HupE/UreJ family protein [Longimicrobiales bacterium]